MKVSFNNIKIRDLCRDKEIAISIIGEKASLKLQNRLADLFSAKSPLELIVGDPSPLSKNSLSYRVKLDDDWVLIFSANNLQLPKNDDGSLKWALVTRIKIDQIKKEI